MIFLAPICSDADQIMGMTAFEMDMAPICDLIQNTTRLGKTRKTLIAIKDGGQAPFSMRLKTKNVKFSLTK